MRVVSVLGSLLAIAFLATVRKASGVEYVQQGPKLADADGVSNQGYAMAVSASGDTLAVGAPYDADGNGATYIYTRSGDGVWQQQGPKLTGAGATEQAQQGCGVALSASGDTLASGACNDNEMTGAVLVYTRLNGTWTQQGPKLVGSGATTYGYFGRGLALTPSGDVLVAKAWNDSAGLSAGWVFGREGGVWTQTSEKLVPVDRVNDVVQGHAVALSGNGTLMAYSGDMDNNGIGAVWMYALANGFWTQLGPKIVPNDNVGPANFGRSLSLSLDANYLAVGGLNDSSGQGATWMFKHVGSTWQQQGSKLVASDSDVASELGKSVSLDGAGATLAVGGFRDQGGIGATWIYTRDENDLWTQAQPKLVGTGAVGNANQGWAVCMSADASTVGVGARFDAHAGTGNWLSTTGAAWVFVGPATANIETPPLSPPALAPAFGTPPAGFAPPGPVNSRPVDSRSAASVGGIIGGCVAGAFALIALVVAGWWLLRRRRTSRLAGIMREDSDSKAPADFAVQPAVKVERRPRAEFYDTPDLVAVTGSGNTSCGARSVPVASSNFSSLSWASPSLLHTLPAEMEPVDVLLGQLNALQASGEPLCGRYVLGDRGERRVGGQGVVAFATHVRNSRQQYAVKFFLDRASFDTEAAYYNDERFRNILPDVEDIVDGDTVFVLNRPLPPMVIMARGESLDEWQQRCHADFAQSMTIMLHVVARVADIHKAGIAHRDLKPANVISYPGRNAWTIIDFGTAAQIGAPAPFACTVAYAAPETILAMLRGERQVIVDAAADVWALGVMAWELFTRTRVFSPGTKELVSQTMLRQLPLPWENTADPSFAANMRRLGFMKDGVLRMLARDPRERTSLASVLRVWRACLQHETTRCIQ